MIATDEEALICDLAETYHILNYRELPCRMVALLSVGLRESSRIKMKMRSSDYPIETELLAIIVDHLAMYIWSKSNDGIHGINKPVSIYEQLHRNSDNSNDIEVFYTPDQFEQKKKEILGKGEM